MSQMDPLVLTYLTNQAFTQIDLVAKQLAPYDLRPTKQLVEEYLNNFFDTIGKNKELTEEAKKFIIKHVSETYEHAQNFTDSIIKEVLDEDGKLEEESSKLKPALKFG